MTIRSAIIAAGATVSLAAMPAAAAELSVSTQRSTVAPAASYDIGEETAQRHRYRGHRGYRGYRGYRGRNGVDAGDVIAGVVILGGIAAIASAASKNRDQDRYRDRRYPTSSPNNTRSSGIDRAVDQCVREVERDARIGAVDGADRTASGWLVTGSLFNGSGFTCRIGSNGRIEGVDYGPGSGYSGQSGAVYQPGSVSRDDRQWNDSIYARARTTAGYTQPDMPGAQSGYTPVSNGASQPYDGPAVQTDGPQPAYPGGPVPGAPQYANEDAYGG